MNDWRMSPPEHIAGVAVTRMLDYAEGLDGLPVENVLKFMLADGSWFSAWASVGNRAEAKGLFCGTRYGARRSSGFTERAYIGCYGSCGCAGLAGGCRTLIMNETKLHDSSDKRQGIG